MRDPGDLVELVRCLTPVPGVSGNEAPVDREILGALAGSPGSSRLEVARDGLGSLVFRLKGDRQERRERSRVLLAAHKDTVGFVVNRVRESSVDVVAVGRPSLSGLEESVPVVIYAPGRRHGGLLQVKGKRINDQMTWRVDLDPEDSRQVRVGDPVAYGPSWDVAGDVVTTNHADDRVGCAVLLSWLANAAAGDARDLGNVDVHVAFTSQEETGNRGGVTAARLVRPDVAVVVDVTWEGADVELGGGPVLTTADAGTLLSAEARDWVVDVAASRGVPVQLEAWSIGSSDAAAVQLQGTGVPTFCLLPPSRGSHSPEEAFDARDAARCLELLEAVVPVIDEAPVPSKRNAKVFGPLPPLESRDR
ncbi:MAG: aminopeptidase [Promethearchaeota archaeon]